MARAKYEYISLSKPHPLRLLHSLQLLRRHRLTRFEPLDLAKAGNIKEHAPPHNAVGICGDVHYFGAVGGYAAHRFSVVELAPVADMAEGVEMAMSRHNSGPAGI